MKKLLLVGFLVFWALGCYAPSKYQENVVVAGLSKDDPVKDIQVVDGFLPVHEVIAIDKRLEYPEALKTIIMTLITPTLQSGVTDFYKPYLTESPQVDAAYSAKIIDICKDADVERYTVSVVVEPYVGAHVAVGKDEMQIDIDATGDVTIKEFEHLQSYDLPEQLQPLIKKALP